MMPLSTTDVQVIKLLNTPKLPSSLFDNAQPISIRVLAVDNNQATILLAGRQLQTQTTVPLAVGQQLTAQPELIDGQLQLKLVPNNDTPIANKLLPNLTTNPNQSLSTQASLTLSNDAKLPSWTDLLPNTAKEALGSLKTSLPTQASLKDLLSALSQDLPSLLSANSDAKLTVSSAWRSFINAALTTNPAPSAEKIQQSVASFNAALSGNSDWKQDLTKLINDPKTPLAEKQIAQGILSKSEQTQQIQTLHQMSGQAVLLQEIPINTSQGLDNFTLEIDVPKPDTPTQEQQWKIFIQLELPQGDFTSRIQMDKDFNVRLQLWGSNEELSNRLQTQANNLKKALQEQGLTIESLIIAEGKPQSRTEQPPWQQPLVDVHG